MATTTISWGDGSGDNIYLTYPSASGDQTVTVTSDANTGSARTKTVTFSATGVSPVTLTVSQDAGSSGRLPAGYTEYDFLQCSSNTVLRTGITGACTWYLTAQCTSPTSSSQILIYDGSTAGRWAGQYNSVWGLGSTYNTTIPSSTKSDLIIDFVSTKAILTIGAVTVERNRSGNFSQTQMFGGGNYFRGKVFGDVIGKQGDTEVFHGIPCTNSNNVAGYYDTVSHSFKAPNSGTLVAGNN